MNKLQALVAVLNSALEHVPPQTKQILIDLAQPNIKALEEALTPAKPPSDTP